MSKVHGECRYCDIKTAKDGKFDCERIKGTKVFADDSADNCNKFWKRPFGYDSDSKFAIQYSKSYKSQLSRQSSSCYITTLLVHILDMPDDCEEMRLLRKLRSYMQKTPKFFSLIKSYDMVGPFIANELVVNEIIDPNELFKFVRATAKYTSKALEYEQLGDIEKAKREYERAVMIYKELYMALFKLYNIEVTVSDDLVEGYHINKKSGHGAIR